MLLALNEVKRNKVKFGMITLILALIVFLMVLLSAMGDGLLTGMSGALTNMNTDLMVFKKDSRLNFQRSALPYSTTEEIAKVAGVSKVTPIGYLILTGESGKKTFDVTVFGIPKGSILEPGVVKGDKIAGANQVIVDQSMIQKNGLAIGDDFKIKDSNQELKVVGATANRKISMMPAIYTDYDTWRQLKLDTMFMGLDKQAGKTIKEKQINAVLVKAKDVKDVENIKKKIEQLDSNLEVATKATVINNWSGMGPMLMVVQMLQGFSFIIGVAIIGVFFYILTMQKTSQLGAIKAMGASNSYILKELITQSTIITIIGALGGVVLAELAIKALPPTLALSSFDTKGIVFSVVGVYLISIIGSLFSVRYIIKIDPGIALGQAQ